MADAFKKLDDDNYFYSHLLEPSAKPIARSDKRRNKHGTQKLSFRGRRHNPEEIHL
jgi:hypothetical protein